MIRAVPFALLLRAALVLASDGEDADTIAAELQRLHPTARGADIWRAADKAAARVQS